ncbi:ATP-dependent helicase [Rhodococcus spelaei]|uniref:DNA 3'-5' helicase n=1 Tax=Rhodococcus spelaei TaxID=2546320 RepID=A0A541BLM5_9NOCA|nr:ATP-dependent DNA helicase [Rhodococcus spelaei]TQF73215.1 ATP-dependent helicase [Rhodococcus spelaei]
MTDAEGQDRVQRSGATLVRRAPEAAAPRVWGADAARIAAEVPGRSARRPWQVLGGPGTGKTSLLVDLAVSRIAGPDGDPESVLVLTHSRKAATAVREAITAGLLGAGSSRATREPLVRTVHSYAFAVLRLQAAAHSNPPPRLITGAEQDAVLREMLRGDVEDGAGQWPERLRPALPMAGFAVELRDLMLRAGERGIGPEDLVKLGHDHHRPEWVAAGKFATRYEQVTLLRGAVGVEAPEATAPALDAAELVGAALSAFATDPDLLARERARVRYLFVDDAQHLDPQAAELIRLLGRGADLAVVAGDPDQSVFGFRGADSRFLTDLAEAGSDRQVVLDTNFRNAERISEITGAIAARLPGLPPHRGAIVRPAEGGEVGEAQVAVLGTPGKESALIADTLRRAHLRDGVPWSRMAVIVRSVPRALAPLRRALLSAGVPVTTASSELPLARQHSVGGLLLVLRAVAGGTFTGEDALALVSGPVGGADPVTLRRLRRGLRRVELATGGERDSAELLRVLIAEGEQAHQDLVGKLTDGEFAALRRVLTILTRARKAHRDGRGVENVLWACWQATGLEKRWAAASARGGPIGAQADRDLDAVVALFDAAANYVDRLPRSTLAGFVEYLADQEIPSDPRNVAAVPGEAVAVLSAHSAAGREWDVVVVAGVQEGLWPGLRARGTLLGTEALVDLTAGVVDPSPGGGTTLSRTAPLLAEERRLFLLACSRARRTLLVTAVRSAVGDADLVQSRFVDELLGRGDVEGELGDSDSWPEPVLPSRVLALPSLIAELRRVVCDPELADTDPQAQARAAKQLARLARAGVRGAHPEHWYGVGGASSEAPLWELEDGPVPLSPSTIEQLDACPLRWALERHGGTDGENTHAVTGTLVHTLVQAVAGKMPPEQVRQALATAWDAVDLGSQWYSRREMDRTAQMIDSFSEWLRSTRGELTEVGVEVAVDGVLEPRGPGEPSIRLRGRIDRLEHDQDGRPVIVDVKTARSPVSKEAAEQHAQLATYQVAALAGAIDGEPPAKSGGARLVFVAKPSRKEGATQRLQAPLTEESEEQWLDAVHAAAAATRGPQFMAKPNDGCRHCPVTSSCPAQETGRQVTGL